MHSIIIKKGIKSSKEYWLHINYPFIKLKMWEFYTILYINLQNQKKFIIESAKKSSKYSLGGYYICLQR